MEIRQYDTSVKIIYLTSSAEYAVDSYSVGAYFYQLKPIWQESFYRLMDSVLSECHKDKENSLMITKTLTEHEDGLHALMVIDICLLYTSPSPRDRQKSRMPSSA